MPNDFSFPNFTPENKSLLKKHLSKERFENLKSQKTAYGFTLENMIRSGAENQDSGIGVYAGDLESYDLFQSLLNPIINEYHGFSKADVHFSKYELDETVTINPDPDNIYIISTRIRVGRNLVGFPLGPAISTSQRQQVESLIVNALSELQGELSGRYFPLSSMSQADRKCLIQAHILFKEGDRFFESAGLNRDWPNGRGIFHNNQKSLVVWVNEEDQLRIISMQSNGNLKDVFNQLILLLRALEGHLTFLIDERLGFISSCPSNLGTAMRASVHIKLPFLSQVQIKLKNIADQYDLQIRGIHGEHSASEGGIFDISNQRRLGISEVDCIKDLNNGVTQLIEEEKMLECFMSR